LAKKTDNNEKSKNLKDFLSKKYPDAMNVDIISEVKFLDTGIPTLNYVFSGRPLTGGMPLTGKITCMYGPEGSGKTSYVAHIMAKAQEKGIEVVYMDTERSITRPRLLQFGVDLDNLIYMTPETMEECFDVIEEICKERAVSDNSENILIIWDSLAMTPTSDEIERKSTDVEIASQARVLSRNLRRIRGKIQLTGAGLLLINQARANQSRYGDLFTMPGGYALQHAADVILRVNKMKPSVDGQGIKISTPIKNRLFRPFQSTTIQFDYSKGFTQEGIIDSFCEFLKQIEILGQSGAWCYLSTDVDELMEAENIDRKEATKKVKKFYIKDFSNRLLEDPEYYREMLTKAEEFVNKNITLVANLTFDEEVKALEHELTSMDIVTEDTKKLIKEMREEE